MTLRSSPLEARWQGLGSHGMEPDGAKLISHFGDVTQEYHALRQGIGIVDRNDRAIFLAQGGDAKKFLHKMLTNDVKALQSGQGCYATLLSNKGKMLADLYIYVTSETSCILDTGMVTHTQLFETLERSIILEKMALEDKTPLWSCLDILGPRAEELLQATGWSTPPEKEYSHSQTTTIPLTSVRLNDYGVPGLRLIFDNKDAVPLFDALMTQQKVTGWQPVGHAALDIVRVEAGLPCYGVDMNQDTLPPEVSLENRAISYTKGCYVGQEVMARIRTYGHVNRQLVGLLFETGPLPERGAEIFADSQAVGRITSAADSPLMGHPVALALVHRNHGEPGTRLSLASGLPAIVNALPFHLPPAA